MMLGLIGDSASGKSTLAAGIIDLLGADQVRDLCLDDYHRFDRAERDHRRITALHPDCNRLDLLKEHLHALRQGRTVRKPVYDHRTGTFAVDEDLAPAPVVVAHGLLGLHDEELRRSYDLSVFLDPDPALRVEWKVRRDCATRGYSAAEVAAQLAKRRADAERFVRPQRDRADMIVTFAPATSGSLDGALNLRMLLRVRARHGALERALHEAAEALPASQSARRVALAENGETLVLDASAAMTWDDQAAIADRLWRITPSPLGRPRSAAPGRVPPSPPLALAQLLVAVHATRVAAAATTSVNAVLSSS